MDKEPRMLSQGAVAFLKNERNIIRRKKLPKYFLAELQKTPIGTLDIGKWDCAIPGEKGTPWEGGIYKLVLDFTRSDYPTEPPICTFTPPIWHPNVGCVKGVVCSSFFHPGVRGTWRPKSSILQILRMVQLFLTDVNTENPYNREATIQCKNYPEKYDEEIRNQAKRFAPTEEDEEKERAKIKRAALFAKMNGGPPNRKEEAATTAKIIECVQIE